jgi:DNA-binding GntR family transcriptional regulator
MGWLVAASGNREIVRSWERVAGQSRLYLNEAARRAVDSKTVMRHAEALIAAVVAGKPAAARKAVRALTEHQIADLGLTLLPSRTKTDNANRH